MNILLEKKYFLKNKCLIVGIDEAGRGPLAGPVAAAAAAILNLNCPVRDFLNLSKMINDSKKLSAAKRESAYRKILACPNLVFGIGIAGHQEIDRINILRASKSAMARAVFDLRAKLPRKIFGKKFFCLVDGNFSIDVPFPQESIVAGDAKVFSIAAASIVAKVVRDELMAQMDKIYPAYGFAKHKGYPTKSHYAALAQYGPCPIHRRSFRLS